MTRQGFYSAVVLACLWGGVGLGCRGQPSAPLEQCGLPADSIAVFVLFRDRQTTQDSVTDVDRRAVTQAAGLIAFIYTIIPQVSVHLPKANLSQFKANQAVLTVDDASGCVYAQGA